MLVILTCILTRKIKKETFNKITKIAEEIGTFEISKIDDGGCSAVPRYPQTHADLDFSKKACKDMNQDEYIQKAYENIRRLD